MNYADLYDDYWQRGDRIGEDSCDMSQLVDTVMKLCGVAGILDVGCGEGALVGELLKRGIDARGLDVSSVVLDRARSRIPDRLVQGSILDLPFADDSFEAVVSTDCMEHIAEEDVPAALRELHRVSSRYVVLQLATTPDRDIRWHATVRDRAWWERACFEAGFRKHAGYYEAINYESLQSEGWQILIPLEKIPAQTARRYPLDVLVSERGLHMDMLRDGGDRSDAHVVRYTLASRFVRPGDRVLDAACGMGYGSHVLASLTQAAEVVGLDNSPFAIDYATSNYGGERTRFELAELPESLRGFADRSFDSIVSFETLEHVPDPRAVLREFKRILSPGGRIFVSVPNDWSDESGNDPNPFHLHVYDWTALHDQIAENFVVERAFQQVATQCKIAQADGRWEFRPRTLKEIDPATPGKPDSEWWLLLGMKEPAVQPQEANDAALARFGTASQQLANPWLNASMIHFGYRLQNAAALNDLCESVLNTADLSSNDHHAALCVRAYRVLENEASTVSEIEAVCRTITDELRVLKLETRMGVRWTVSLLFVRAKLEQKLGRLEQAVKSFESAAGIDFLRASVHLATKTAEALFQAGYLSLALGRGDRAAAFWRRALALANTLLSVQSRDILIDIGEPNLFDHGDGIREYVLAWDFVARAANGLHLLRRGKRITPSQIGALMNSFSHKVDVLNRDLVRSRLAEQERIRSVGSLTAAVHHSQRALHERTAELVATRETLVERTQALATILDEVRVRDTDLVQTRQLLQERTDQLERAATTLGEHTRDLTETRATLVERTVRLEASFAEFARLQEMLAERTDAVATLAEELQARDAELVRTRQLLVERTESLETAVMARDDHAHALAETRALLEERTTMLENHPQQPRGSTND